MWKARSPALILRIPQGRPALRGAVARGRDWRRNRRAGLPDGQPQRRQWYPHPHRSLTRRCKAGYWSQPKSHNAVGVAVAQSRADWGIAIETVARQYGLGFIPAQDEHYDFIVPKARLARPAVQRFRAVLEEPVTRDALTVLGFRI